MGYRSRLGKINKKGSEFLRNFSWEEAEEYFNDHNNGGMSYPSLHTQLYEIGKYYSFPSEDPLEPFYKNFDIYKKMESEFHIMQEKHLRIIIDDFHSQIFEYFEKLLANEKDREAYFINKVNEWKPKNWEVYPYHLKRGKTDGEIVRSWKMEYSIFNITYIYRTFDWENDYLIWSAW